MENNNEGQKMESSIEKIAEALCKAQAQIRGAKANVENKFFSSSYADLESVWEAARESLTSNGLSVAQPTELIGSGNDAILVIKTILMHTSGQSITGIMPIYMGDKKTPQSMGSAISYSRRYALASMVGIYQTDDDAESTVKRETKSQQKNSSAPVNQDAPRKYIKNPVAEQSSPKIVPISDITAEPPNMPVSNITFEQVTELVKLAKSKGRAANELSEYLWKKYKVQSPNFLPSNFYDEVFSFLNTLELK
jgi:hypothetical protein